MNLVIYVLRWFKGPKPAQPIPYMQRPDIQAALELQAKARSRHAKGANAVPELTHELLKAEVGPVAPRRGLGVGR